MKCNQCGSEWSVPDKLKQSLMKCPFCGTDLNIKENTTIADVLVEWGKKEGLDFFRNSIKINGILADMFPSMERERNAIKIGLEKGIGAKIIQLHCEDDEGIRNIQISQIEKILLDDAWLSESATEFVLTTFITASDIVGGKNVRQYTRKATPFPNNKGAECVSNKADERDRVTNIQEMPNEQKEALAKQKAVSVQITELLNEGEMLEASGKDDEAIKAYAKAILLGDSEAAYRAGKVYYRDERMLAKSVECFMLAANQGDSRAQVYLGNMYETGKGVTKDLNKAFYCYQKAAVSGSIAGQHNLANCYYCGHGTQVDYKKAFEWYKKAASQGDSEAQNNLAICYYHGHGTQVDYKKAFEWYKKAASQGERVAQTGLAICYYHGHGTQVDYKKAFEWYKKAASQGYSVAQKRLADCYYHGHATQVDYKKAFEWYKKAASQGDSEAQNNLAICYYHGHGTQVDYKKAFEWYKKAASQGISRAQKQLASCYYHGHGTQVDYKKAFEWYKKAASQGISSAQTSLGILYENGYGVEKNINQAIKWYKMAADNGSEEGLIHYDRCIKLVGRIQGKEE